ncbi:MAG TPA: HEAT repeat domain-containing protein [Acidobacteriota bacterium]|jgi:cyclophilin family peptidyl-prolyl cis-trans isomerase
MRSRFVSIFLILFLLAAVPAEAKKRKRVVRRHTRAARTVAIKPSPVDTFARILQREDSRWIGSDNFLFDLTRSKDTAFKMRALLALGRIGDPRALPWLFERLVDLNPLVRARALFAAGEIVDTSNRQHEGFDLRADWISTLLSALGDSDPLVRTRAVEAIGKSGQKDMADSVVAAIQSNVQNVEFVTRALMALARLGATPALSRALFLKSHASAEVRWQLANAIYRLRDAPAAEQIVSLLDDRTAQVRAHAARACGLAGEKVVSRLSDLLKDSNLSVRIEAARGLGLTKSPAAGERLVALLEKYVSVTGGEDEHLVIAAIESLGSIGAAPRWNVVAQFAKQRRPASAAAVLALAKARKGDETFPAEVDISSDPFWLQRSKILALGENGSQAALEKLVSLDSQLPAGRKLLLPWCLDAIIQTGKPVAPEAFWRYLADPDPILRAHAIQALAELSRRAGAVQPWSMEAADRVLQSYFQFQSEGTTDARLAAVDFFATLSAPAAVPRLESVARDADRNVRLRARQLLTGKFQQSAGETAGLVNTGRNHQFYVNAINTVKSYSGARFETDRGSWKIEFLGEHAPLTVYNFITLAQKRVFNNLIFPRVVPDFVVQGGDPRNDTDGGPGYAIRCEINDRPFERGAVGMALSGKDTGGSQYFICHSTQPHLDGGYTVFAQVTGGISAVDRIQVGDRVTSVELIPR